MTVPKSLQIGFHHITFTILSLPQSVLDQEQDYPCFTTLLYKIVRLWCYTSLFAYLNYIGDEAKF